MSQAACQMPTHIPETRHGGDARLLAGTGHTLCGPHASRRAQFLPNDEHTDQYRRTRTTNMNRLTGRRRRVRGALGGLGNIRVPVDEAVRAAVRAGQAVAPGEVQRLVEARVQVVDVVRLGRGRQRRQADARGDHGVQPQRQLVAAVARNVRRDLRSAARVRQVQRSRPESGPGRAPCGRARSARSSSPGRNRPATSECAFAAISNSAATFKAAVSTERQLVLQPAVL